MAGAEGFPLPRDPLLEFADGCRKGAIGGVYDMGLPTGVLGGPGRPALPRHGRWAVGGDDLGTVPGIPGVAAVPGRPAIEPVRVGSRPTAWVTFAQPASPLIVVHIDQAHRDGVQSRRRRGREDLAE